MKIKVTGDLRQVAESAWISTLNQIKAKARSDQDAVKVVKYLIENQHTSPLESVTVSFHSEYEGEIYDESSDIYPYGFVSYSRSNSELLVLDLLNFLKLTYENSLFDKKPWQLFSEVCPDLAELCLGFKKIAFRPHNIKAIDYLGPEHGMEVELINFHDVTKREFSRATWRIKCPLSISLQIARHRLISLNQSSGRYRTLNTEMIGAVNDCKEIFEKVGIDLSEYLKISNQSIILYKESMEKAKTAKNENLISNKEYKRFREFARFILPEGRMTEIYVTFYLDYFYEHYLALRDAEDVQIEHIFVAQEMKKVLEEKIHGV